VIDRLADPVFETVSDCFLLLLTVTLPNVRLPGVTEICANGLLVPIPLSGTVVGDVGALVTNDRLPLTLPEAEGANCTVIVPEPPAATVIGSASPVVLRPEPDTFAEVIDRLADPVFETVSDCFPLLPTVTLLNVRLPGVTEICADELSVPIPFSGMTVEEAPSFEEVVPELSVS
jgi:hypothetical protein